MKRLFLFLAGMILAAAPALAQGGPGPMPSPWIVNGSQVYYSQGCVTIPYSAPCNGPGTLSANALYDNGNRVLTTATTPVNSVFGRTGIVTAQSGDYSFSLISGIIASGQVAGAYTGINRVGVLTNQTQVNLNTAGIQGAQTGSVIQLEQANGVAGRLEMDTFAAAGYNSTVRSDGTAASPTAIQSGEEIGGFNAWGYNGTSIVGPNASFRTYAAQNWSVGANATYADVATTATGSTTLTEVEKWWPDGGVTVGAPTGSDEGAGTLNIVGAIYNNGTAPTGTGGYVRATSPTLVTPALGTPSALILTNATGTPTSIGLANGTGLPVSTGISGLGTGVATALGNAVSGSGSLCLTTNCAMVTPALGTPSALVLTNATGTPSSIGLANGTGLPVSTGISGLGTGVATALAVNTGSAGAFIVNGGAGGTPSSLTLTNATGLPAASVLSGALANGMTATTQTTSDSSTKIATDAFVKANTASGARCFNNTAYGTAGGYSAASTVMTGFGSHYYCTPTSTGAGDVGFACTGDIGTLNAIRTVVIYYGTGTAPAFTAAPPGGSVGIGNGQSTIDVVANGPVGFTLVAHISGLTPTTQYWFDIGSSVSAGALDMTCVNEYFTEN